MAPAALHSIGTLQRALQEPPEFPEVERELGCPEHAVGRLGREPLVGFVLGKMPRLLGCVEWAWEDALVLTRALLSVVLRSLHLVQPDDTDGVCVNVNTSGTRRGRAYRSIPRVSSAPPSSKYVITLGQRTAMAGGRSHDSGAS